MDTLLNIDFQILNLIQNLKCTFLDKTIPLITKLGDVGIIWIIFSIILLFSKKYKLAGILCLVALLIEVTMVDGIIKFIVKRPRPFTYLTDYTLLIKTPISYSFPSGHTASSFAAAFTLGNYMKKYKIAFFTLAFLIAFSRLYLYVHFPSDILFGVLFGLFSYLITNYLYKIYLNTNSPLKKLK